MADKQSGTGARGKQQQAPKGNSSTSKGEIALVEQWSAHNR